MSQASIRVQFIHGLESSPQGDKARYLARHFDALAPAMDTRDFEGCVRVQAEALERFEPDVLVGSSFGGAVAVALLKSGTFTGPALLLAPAVGAYGMREALPAGIRVCIVHGTRDTVVPIEDSRALAATGAPALVDLIEIDDEHRLRSLLDAGRLEGLVRKLAAWRRGRAGVTP